MNLRRFILWFILIPSTLISEQLRWAAITSYLNTTDVEFYNESTAFASTSGGILKFDLSNESLETISFENGLFPTDLTSISTGLPGKLLIGSVGEFAILQIYDVNSGSFQKINHLEWIDSITNFQVWEDRIFSIVTSGTQYAVVEFKIDGDQVNYQDYYQYFPLEFSKINDIEIYQNELIISTDQGLMRTDLTSSTLHSNDQWSKEYEGIDISQTSEGYIVFSELYDSPVIDVINNNENIKILTESTLYEIDAGNETIIRFTSDNGSPPFTGFDLLGNKIIISRENYGLTLMDINDYSPFIHIPNTLMQNEFQAITILENGGLAGISDKGGFIQLNDEYYNFTPIANQNIYPLDIDQPSNEYIGLPLPYNVGGFMPWSIVESNEYSLLFSNSGKKPTGDDPANGALIELDYQSFEVTTFDTTDGILDGLGGLIDNNGGDWYTVINHITKDVFGNIWVVNPYAEHTNQLAAIQSPGGEWYHVRAGDEQSYLPQEIAFGPQNKVWFGFRYYDNPTLLSSGGIKVLNYNGTLSDQSDDEWDYISNPDVLPGGENKDIWSLVFSKTEGEDVLWVLTSYGVQGYLVEELTLTPISTEFFSHLPLYKGDRLRVDAQNNVWVITRHSGVRVIQPDIILWPSAEGFTTENSGLLSNIVNDVAFDTKSGMTYLSTNKGISTLQTTYASESTAKTLKLSPNPFLIPSEELLSIWQMASGSVVRIMTLNGYVLKTFHLTENQNRINNWDGRKDSGDFVTTGIYLISASHSDGFNAIGKLAVIRQ